MKTAIIVAAALCASATNAKVHRMRTKITHKSTTQNAEKYDPYMGIEEDRMLTEHSMSMSMSYPESLPVDVLASSAATAGAAVSVLAIAGAMMLL